MIMRILFAISLIFTPVSGAVAEYRVVIEIADCRPAPRTAVQMHGSNWIGWNGYIFLCSIQAPDGQVALNILTVGIDPWEEDHPGIQGAQFPKGPVPNALVLDKRLEFLGTMTTPLGGGFPGSISFDFSDWREGLPWRIDAHNFHNPTFGDYDEPALIWNPARRRYEVRKK